MFTRQKIALNLLARAGEPLPSTVFVKLMFLLRHETELEKDHTFYDFVPMRSGPFSFALYWELGSLERKGFVTLEGDRISLRHKTLSPVEEKTTRLPASARRAVSTIVDRYRKLNSDALVEAICAKYPWYAINSELSDGRAAFVHRGTDPAVYTVGYEGKSIDAFFNELLMRGMEVVVDVRANPISRKYGFSRKHFSRIAGKLGMDYWHVPRLGIPSSSRANLNGYGSYQRLLNRYESTMLPRRKGEISEVARLMRERPSVLVCLEKDVRCCHRSRLADAISREIGLEVTHL